MLITSMSSSGVDADDVLGLLLVGAGNGFVAEVSK